MTFNKGIQKLLRFKGLKVVDFTFEGTDRLSILVKTDKNGCRCPECERRCNGVLAFVGSPG